MLLLTATADAVVSHACQESYSRRVMDLIDPTSSFGGEILCRKDGGQDAFDKSVLHLAPGSDSTSAARRRRMIVLDDREEAWCVESRPNVLPIPQFKAWSEDGTPTAAPEADPTLLDMLAVLRAVSRDLASGAARSVPAALQQRRQSILRGCVLVFSGGLLRDHTKPEINSSWRMAVALGARCDGP